MRKLASFEDPDLARALSETLYAARIDSDVREDGSERSVWVLSESDVPRAEAVLREFTARGRRAASPRPGLVERARQSPVSYVLIAICVLVSVATELLHHEELLQYLMIASFDLRADGWHDLARGQLWRAVTPIFVHFGPFHLIFNMFWVMDAGGTVERVQGPVRYTLFVLWTAAASNLAQLAFGPGPGFGGMSGVVYAYISYLWVRGLADPSSGIRVPGSLIGFFIAWMALGFSGLMDRILAMANYCHLGGFVAGAAAGYVAGVRARRRAQPGRVW
ncbi:MAG TPA: rhomboid family intramembrane serine protease [Polyangiales bacterium]|nr:rhomboid family intramembrane serine protease [Polyangiales bacterium]